MPQRKDPSAKPSKATSSPRQGNRPVVPDKPAVPKVERLDPRSPQFRREVREEIAKEKLDP